MKISNLRFLVGILAICNLQFAICNSFAQINISPGLSISGTPTSGQIALWSDATTLLGNNLLVADTADGSLTIRKNQNGATRLDILNGTDDVFAEALFSMGGGSTTLTIEALSVLFSDAPGLESPGDCIFLPSADIVFAPGFGRTKFGAGDGAGGTLELSIGLPLGGSVASGASAILDEINIPARTATIIGTTHVTTAKGFNKVSIYQPTYTDTSSVTIDRGATLYIEDAPTAAGSVTLTSGYALWVDNGAVRFDGGLTVGGTAAPSSGVINASTGFTIGGAAASGHYPRGNATNYIDGTIQAGDVPTLNQDTTGSASKWTTARNLAGNSVDGSANVAFANKFIVQGTSDAGLSAAQFLGSLGTGIVKNTTTTGVLSIAVAGDFPTLNQNTNGSAATLTTTRALWGQNFNGSAAVGGAIELGTAGTTDTTLDRSAAGIPSVEGIDIPPHYSIRAATTVTQANDANAHAIFTTPTNGRITLPTGVYHFRGSLAWTSMSATTGNVKVDLLGAGTATTTNWLWRSVGQDATAASANNMSGGWFVTSASGVNVVANLTATACFSEIEGDLEVTVTGTLIPTQTLHDAAAAVLSVGSVIEFWRKGATGMTSTGPWD